jgi:predicted RNA polymerase sigma factor
MSEPAIQNLLPQLAPQVLGAVVRRYGHFDIAEDAVQDAMLAAATQWSNEGLPDNPNGWLITVAARRLTDLLRSEQARRRREDTVSEATMTRRITRAKQQIKDSRVPFRLPPPEQRAERLAVVLHVLYLIFTEGYAATSGGSLYRAELSAEAIRLTRIVHHLLPDDGEVAGLLALMLLTDARRPARTTANGELVLLAEQDRTLWDADKIAEGVALITEALPRKGTGLCRGDRLAANQGA